MKFHGLFIGIDKYASSLVADLSCASRDAQALFGLFSDTFGSKDSELLTNEQATRDAIVSAFGDRLSKTVAEDLVIVSFSGHGSDSHRLVTHEADPADFDATSVHL